LFAFISPAVRINTPFAEPIHTVGSRIIEGTYDIKTTGSQKQKEQSMILESFAFRVGFTSNDVVATPTTAALVLYFYSHAPDQRVVVRINKYDMCYNIIIRALLSPQANEEHRGKKARKARSRLFRSHFTLHSVL
jgi:hypothetical protein